MLCPLCNPWTLTLLIVGFLLIVIGKHWFLSLIGIGFLVLAYVLPILLRLKYAKQVDNALIRIFS
jgi:glucose dehydrogenase